MKKKNPMKAHIMSAVMIASSFIFAFSAHAAPSISGVSGTVGNGLTITVSGTDFGDSGPNVILFDDFSRGTDGQTITLPAPVGNWSGVSGNAPIYEAEDGGNIAGRLVDGDVSRQLQINFDPVQEIFLSYRIRIPEGYHFPNTSQPGTFAPDSAWKMAWIMDGSSGYRGDDDICLPTWGNGTYFSLIGNDGGIKKDGVANPLQVGRPGTENHWFSFSDWNRFSVHMKAGNPDPILDKGLIFAQGLSEEFGQKTIIANDRTLFDGDDNVNDNAISQWTRLNFSGWHRSGGVNAVYDHMTRGLYDDIYLATGSNSQARIEIGDASVYSDSTKLTIITPDNWSGTSIMATVREGGFSEGEQGYLFVVDSNNNPSVGYPITFSSTSESDAATPVVPEEPIDGSAPNPDPISTTPGYSVSDFANILLEWMKSGTSLQGDVNKDGTVNSMDLGVIMSNWE